jgi:hypothetical protein
MMRIDTPVSSAVVARHRPGGSSTRWVMLVEQRPTIATTFDDFVALKQGASFRLRAAVSSFFRST